MRPCFKGTHIRVVRREKKLRTNTWQAVNALRWPPSQCQALEALNINYAGAFSNEKYINAILS